MKKKKGRWSEGFSFSITSLISWLFLHFLFLINDYTHIVCLCFCLLFLFLITYRLSLLLYLYFCLNFLNQMNLYFYLISIYVSVCLSAGCFCPTLFLSFFLSSFPIAHSHRFNRSHPPDLLFYFFLSLSLSLSLFLSQLSLGFLLLLIGNYA